MVVRKAPVDAVPFRDGMRWNSDFTIRFRTFLGWRSSLLPPFSLSVASGEFCLICWDITQKGGYEFKGHIFRFLYVVDSEKKCNVIIYLSLMKKGELLFIKRVVRKVVPLCIFGTKNKMLCNLVSQAHPCGKGSLRISTSKSFCLKMWQILEWTV